MKYIIADTEGFIHRAGEGVTLPEDAIAIETPIPATDLHKFIWDGEALIERPDAPEITIEGVTVTLLGVPAQTVVTAHDLLAQEPLGDIEVPEDDDLEIELEAGSYEIEVITPNPYLNASYKVELSE